MDISSGYSYPDFSGMATPNTSAAQSVPGAAAAQGSATTGGGLSSYTNSLKKLFPGLLLKDGSWNPAALAKLGIQLSQMGQPTPYQAGQTALKYAATQSQGLNSAQPGVSQFRGLNTTLPAAMFKSNMAKTNYASGGALRGVAAAAGPAGPVPGTSAGQADDVPAMLSSGEFVLPADVVSHLGDGNNNAGALKLHAFMKGIRKHKGAGPGLPPPAKAPAHYMGRK
jgi:hypothetical protein